MPVTPVIQSVSKHCIESRPQDEAQGKALRRDLKSDDESTAQREGAGALGAGVEPVRAELPAGAVAEKGSQGDWGVPLSRL